MSIPNNYYFPYFPSPPPAAAKPPSHPTSPPPAAKPPGHLTPPPPPPAAKPPSHSTPPPPPHQPFRPPPPHIHPPPPLPPHHGPPPPPHQPFRPPPPHVHPPPALPPHHGPPSPPLPPSPSPNNHPTVIVIVFISFGSVFFLAFLAVALCCFIKKRKKKSTIQETEIIHFDEHRKIKEAIVEGPHGPQAVVLSVEDDVHIDKEIKKNEKSDKRWPSTSSNVQEETDIIHVTEHEKVKEDIVEGPHGSKTVVLTVEDDIHVDEKIRKNEKFGKDGHHHHLVHKAGQ